MTSGTKPRGGLVSILSEIIPVIDANPMRFYGVSQI